MSLTKFAFVATLLTPATAFAVPHFTAHAPLPMGTVQPREGCTNFKGSWKGTCSSTTTTDGQVSHETREESQTIEQIGCQSLTVDQQVLPLGGSSTTSESNKDGSNTVVTMPDWSLDQTVIVAKITGSSRVNVPGVSVVSVSTGAIAMSMDDQQLKSETTMETDTVTNGTASHLSNKETCVDTKQ